MCELQAWGDVADSEDARDVRAQALVDKHPAALHGDALLLEAHAARVRAAADSDEKDVSVEGLAVLESDVHAIVILSCGCETNAGREVDAALAEGTLKCLAARFVLVGNQARQTFDDGDLGAEGSPDAGELDTDDTAAEHDGARGNVIEIESLIGGHDAAADLEARQGARVRAGSENDMRAGVLLATDLDSVRTDKTAGAFDEGHVATLHQTLKALVEATDNAIAVLVDLDHVDAVQCGVDAELLALASGVSDLGCVQKRLGGDATAMQAGAAELVLVDQDD